MKHNIDEISLIYFREQDESCVSFEICSLSVRCKTSSKQFAHSTPLCQILISFHIICSSFMLMLKVCKKKIAVYKFIIRKLMGKLCSP